MPDPKARPATAFVRRLPVATSEPRGPSTGTKHGVAPGRLCLHGGSRSDCSERGVASDPVECRTTAVLIRAGASDVAASGQVWSPAVREIAASRASTTPLDLASREPGGNRFLPCSFASSPLARRRRCVAVACRRRIHGIATAVLRRPFSAAREIASSRSTCFRISHCWATQRGGSRCLSGFTSSSRSLRRSWSR